MLFSTVEGLGLWLWVKIIFSVWLVSGFCTRICTILSVVIVTLLCSRNVRSEWSGVC